MKKDLKREIQQWMYCVKEQFDVFHGKGTGAYLVDRDTICSSNV